MKPLSVFRSKLPRHGVRELMVRSSGIPGAIHLEVGEPDAATPAYIQNAAVEAIKTGWFHYTPNVGIEALREAVATAMNGLYGSSIAPENVVATPGAVTALALGLQCTVDAGEEVLVPDPSWPNYWQMVYSQGAVPVFYTLRPEAGFLPDFDELERLVTPRTKAIMINSPGNPTGGVFDETTVKRFVEFAVKHDLYLISDEIYDQLVYEGTHVPASRFDTDGRVLSVYGVSKNYAMTGWRVGFLIANKKITDVAERTIEPLFSCVNSVAQKAAEAAYRGPQDFVYEQKEVYKRRRDIAFEFFKNEGIRAYKPSGAFYMLVDCSGTAFKTEDFAFRLLDEESVAVGPGATFGKTTKEMMRISLAAAEDKLIEGVKRISRFLKKYRK